MPDMRPIRVGGPSAHGAGKGAGLELLFKGIHLLLNYLNDRKQQSKAQSDLRALEKRIEQDLKSNPAHGVLLTFRYIMDAGNPEAAGSPGYRYTDVMYGRGLNMSEARLDQARHPQIKQGIRPGESYKYEERWVAPTKKSGVAALRRPFRVIGAGSFVQGKAKLEKVKYTTVQDFDDEGAVKVSLTQKTVGQGGKTIPVVKLDTLLGIA